MSWSPMGVKGLLIKVIIWRPQSPTTNQIFCPTFATSTLMRNTVTSEALLHWSYWLHNISNAVTHLTVPDVCHFCYYILILHWSSIEKMHGTMESTIFPQRNAECLSDISLWRRPLNQEQCLWLSCTDFTVVEA